MRKCSKIIAFLLIFCLVFSTASFAAQGEGGEGASQEAGNTGGRWDRGCREMPFMPGTEFQIVTLDDVAWNSGAYSGTPSAEKIPANMPHYDTPKEIPLLVLVVGFSNISYQDSYDWSNHIFKGKDSLAQYYKDMSFNQFTFVPAQETSVYGTGGNTNTKDAVNDGVVHVKLNAPHKDWATQNDAEMKDYVQDLVNAIKSADDYVNFASFDKNGDGELTNNEFALAVVAAGYEGAFDRNMPYGADYYLWSFAWNISSGWYSYFQNEYPGESGRLSFMPSPDGVYVDRYITIPEQLVPGSQEPISVLAHELGHYLGLPDLYTTDYNYEALWGAYDAGYLSVMCSGSWGWDKSTGTYRPLAFDAWSRCVLGWVDPQVVSEGMTYDVVSDKGNYNVLMVETGNEGDYYLLENREYSGWDAGLNINGNDGYWSGYRYADHAPNGGLICWHIDDGVYNEYAGSNMVNNTVHRPAVMPLFPEKTTNGMMTFIGKIDFFEGTAQPFFTYDIWNSRYKKDLGDWMFFPKYNGSDQLDDRSYSGMNMKFIQNSAGHTVTVQFGEKAEFERYAGSNRYLTAIKAADAYLKKTGRSSFDTVIIASGMDYADALAGSYLAITENAPILLVNDGAAAVIAEYVYNNTTSASKVYILGGTGAVSDKFSSALTGKGFPSGNIERIWGSNRYATNTAILDKAGYAGKDLLVCYGLDYADSLSASAVGRPIFLVGKALTGDQKEFLSTHGSEFNNVYIIGGTGVVSDAVAAEIAGYVKGEYTRVAGANRYTTSVEVAKRFFDSSSTKKVYLAYALDYPDGLAGGPLASIEGAPMLLITNPNNIYAKAYAEEAGIKNCAVMGGTALIFDKNALAVIGK